MFYLVYNINNQGKEEGFKKESEADKRAGELLDNGVKTIDLYENDDYIGEYTNNLYDEYENNCYCDTTGYCCGSSCPNFPNCHPIII